MNLFSQPTTRIKHYFNYWPFVGFVASLICIALSPMWALAGLCVFGRALFKGTLNLLQGVGPLYWITRDNALRKTPFISIGIMRELNPPWRIGKGIQFTYRTYSFQIGLCKKHRHKTIEDGELAAMGARYMDVEPKELGNWK